MTAQYRQQFLMLVALLLALPCIAFGQQTAQDFVKSGNAKKIKGDWDGAIADYSKAIELNPEDADAYKLRASARHGVDDRKVDDWDGVIFDYSKAIELDPKDPETYYYRAYAKKAKGDQVGADADFAQSAKCGVLAGLRTEDYQVATNGKAITITKFVGSEDPIWGAVVAIPSKINGLPVTRIGNRAFLNHSDIHSVTIPNSVISIEDAGFWQCYRLTSVTIPNSVTNIGNDAFAFCTRLTSIMIPNSVISLGKRAFANSGLTNIAIPNSITIVGDGAFSGCNSLKSVTIPDSVTSIGYLEFQGCNSLTNITISASVTNIGEQAFDNCTNLTGVYFRGNAPSLGQNVFVMDDNATIYYLPETTGWGKTFGGRPTAVWKQ